MLVKVAGSGVLLFADQLVVALGGWLYWLIISKLATPSEIGQATALSSLVLLIAAITELGIEYPLLKNSQKYRKILGTALVIEIITVLGSMPVAIVAISYLYNGILQALAGLALLLLIFSSVGFVARFSLLGISKAKEVLMIDLFGILAKFISGYILLSMGFGVVGIIISFVALSVITTSLMLLVSRKSLKFEFGSLQFAKEILSGGLVNLPSKLSRVILLSLSVVLLGYLGVQDYEVGLFYMALMISVVVGGLASSMALMVIPASSAASSDLSAGSLRIGLSLTAPLVALLLTSPTFVLSILGTEYSSADNILVVLSVGIIPATIVANAVSRFNNRSNSYKLIVIGVLQLAVFLGVVFVTIPLYGVIGAAYATLAAFIASAIPCAIWSEHSSLRHILICIAAVAVGVTLGRIIDLISNMPPIALAVSVASCFLVVIVLKITSTQEIIALVRSVVTDRTR